MNCIIPFTKDVKFKSNIAEILSVSLEHDYTANETEVLGNFTISGEYKVHEVSVNKEHFEYVLPFSVNMTNKIDTNSVNFEVQDFTYEVIDNDTLRVNIEYSINADELKEEEPLFKQVEEPTLDNLLDEIDREVEEEPKEEVKEERDISEETKDTILNNINDSDDVYVTYHIHEMKETDTVESICLKYNTSDAILGEYNDLSTLTLGDKIIIPEINE
jgi:hypothetical protein